MFLCLMKLGCLSRRRSRHAADRTDLQAYGFDMHHRSLASTSHLNVQQTNLYTCRDLRLDLQHTSSIARVSIRKVHRAKPYAFRDHCPDMLMELIVGTFCECVADETRLHVGTEVPTGVWVRFPGLKVWSSCQQVGMHVGTNRMPTGEWVRPPELRCYGFLHHTRVHVGISYLLVHTVVSVCKRSGTQLQLLS